MGTHPPQLDGMKTGLRSADGGGGYVRFGELSYIRMTSSRIRATKMNKQYYLAKSVSFSVRIESDQLD